VPITDTQVFPFVISHRLICLKGVMSSQRYKHLSSPHALGAIEMAKLYPVLTTFILSVMIVAGTAYAQAPTPTPPPAPASPSIGERLETKVKQKEDKLEANWKGKKHKLADCRQQAKEKYLHGRKRWKYIAKCVI